MMRFTYAKEINLFHWVLRSPSKRAFTRFIPNTRHRLPGRGHHREAEVQSVVQPPLGHGRGQSDAVIRLSPRRQLGRQQNHRVSLFLVVVVYLRVRGMEERSTYRVLKFNFFQKVVFGNSQEPMP